MKSENAMGWYRLNLILFLALFSLLLHQPAGSAEESGSLLPASGFAGDWVRDGEIATYNAENLYMYIDGEAELFMPTHVL